MVCLDLYGCLVCLHFRLCMVCMDLYGCLVCLDIGGLALGGYTLGNGHSMQTDKKHRNMGIQI